MYIFPRNNRHLKRTMTSPTIIRLFLFLLLVMAPTQTLANDRDLKNIPVGEPFTDLNLRFSNNPLTPPDNLIVQTIPLNKLSVARPFVAPSPQAVIFEDDQRQRLAVLSTNDTGHLILYLLKSLALDPKLPSLVQCANDRGCETDRTPLTGGLGCLALCLKGLLETIASNPLPR